MHTLGMEVVFTDNYVSIFFPSVLMVSTEPHPHPVDYMLSKAKSEGEEIVSQR